jgi:ADP-heptose:LPS heptosyltransferase
MRSHEGQPQRRDSILVVSLDNLGDLVLASALLDPLRERFPRARIGLWCKAYASGLAPLLAQVDAVYASDPFWDRSPGTEKGSVKRFLSTAASVKRARFDTAILVSAPWRTAAAVATTGIRRRIGLERRRNRLWLTDVLPPEDRTKPVLHEVARLLGPLGIHPADLRYRLDASHLTDENAIVRKALGAEPFVTLHPFAGSENRCVSLDEWVRVAEEFAARDMLPLWIGTATELRKLRNRSDARANWHYSDDLGNGSLTAVAVAISRARIFIGHDSGPMHIAAALSVPTVGVFAPGEPVRTFPQGSGQWRMVSGVSPAEITANDILEEAWALLDE